MNVPVSLDQARLADFCRQRKIRQLALFGSVLRDDFQPESDVDVLVTFADEADWSLLDGVAMQEEVSAILGRKVDLVNRAAIERSQNWLRRGAILSSAQTIYESRY